MRPRPDNMFEGPQESSIAPKRDKLLFIEAMVASGELTGRELRVGILLVSMWSPTRGFSYPSRQYIADALNLNKRNVGKALARLEEARWFLIGHGSRGRGRNHVNHYIPNREKVSSETPFREAAERAKQRLAEQEKVSIRPGKGVKLPEKVSLATPEPVLRYPVHFVQNRPVLRTAPRLAARRMTSPPSRWRQEDYGRASAASAMAEGKGQPTVEGLRYPRHATLE